MSLNLRAAAGLGLFCVSISVLAASSLLLVESAWANFTKYPTCTASTSCDCATCASTSDVYQCDPIPLTQYQVYGTCKVLSISGICVTVTPPVSGCGSLGMNCNDPPGYLDYAPCTNTPCICSTL